MSSRFFLFIRKNSVMASEFILNGYRDKTYLEPGIDAVTACLILRIFSVKKEANSLQALVERCSDATVTGGFVSLSTAANRARTLLLFLVMMSEKKDCLAFLSSRLKVRSFSLNIS